MDKSLYAFQRRFILEMRNNLNAEEASKISKRVAKISERIDNVFYKNVVNQASAFSHENPKPDGRKKAFKTFVSEVLKLDDELMKEYMGRDWEEGMASHAITAKDIAVNLKQPDPSISLQELIEYIVILDELAIREEATKELN